ncbi:MAG: hypothetical protein ACOCX2_03525 [Armatimonadota bacterium]
MTPKTATDVGGAKASEELSWSARRAADQPGLTVLVAIFELVLSAGVYMYYGLSFALLTFGVITLALIPFYASFRYVLRRDGLEVHGPFYYTPYEWKQFEGWRLSDDDLRLIYKKRRSSVLVLHAPHNMQKVVTFVQGSLPRMSEEDRRL